MARSSWWFGDGSPFGTGMVVGGPAKSSSNHTCSKTEKATDGDGAARTAVGRAVCSLVAGDAGERTTMTLVLGGAAGDDGLRAARGKSVAVGHDRGKGIECGS